MKRHTALLVLAGLVGLAGTARADETTFCNFFITTLPYTIAAQGHYCFDRNLSTAITTGNAITVAVDFVVIDLNNFKLGGGSAGPTTQAVGIFADNRRNITIRNGNIRGFKRGILLRNTLSPTTVAGGHVIENNVLDGNTYVGVEAYGDLIVARNNIVANTGGSTVGWSYGIYLGTNGTRPVATARDNVIQNVFNTVTPGGTSVGIYAATNVDHNLIRMGTTAGTGSMYGIWSNVCRDNTVLDSSPATKAFGCTQVGANYTNNP